LKVGKSVEDLRVMLVKGGVMVRRVFGRATWEGMAFSVWVTSKGGGLWFQL
jgi:hypothetical protein